MKATIRLPQLPNFLGVTIEGVNGTAIDAGTKSVADFSPYELRAFGQRWTAALLEHAQKNRAATKDVSSGRLKGGGG